MICYMRPKLKFLEDRMVDIMVGGRMDTVEIIRLLISRSAAYCNLYSSCGGQATYCTQVITGLLPAHTELGQPLTFFPRPRGFFLNSFAALRTPPFVLRYKPMAPLLQPAVAALHIVVEGACQTPVRPRLDHDPTTVAGHTIRPRTMVVHECLCAMPRLQYCV